MRLSCILFITTLCCNSIFAQKSFYNDTQQAQIKYNHEKALKFAESFEPDSIQFYANKNLKIIVNGDNKNLADCYSMLMIAEYNYYNMSKSIEYGNKAIVYAEKNLDDNQLGMLYGELGSIYAEVDDTARALSFTTKGLEYALKTKDTALYIGNYAYLAYVNLYFKLDLYKSIKLYQKALFYTEAIHDTAGYTRVLGYLALPYLVLKKNNEAIAILKKAYLMGEKTSDVSAQLEILQRIAFFYTNNIIEPKTAIEYLQKALPLAQEPVWKQDLNRIYEIFSVAYKQLGNYKLALDYYIKHVNLQKELDEQKASKEIINTNIKYETEKKNLQIGALEENQTAQAKIKWLLIGGIVMALLASLFSYRAFRNKQKYSLVIAAEDKRKELLLQEIHHRVNNNLQIISSLLELQADESNNNVVQEYLQQSQSRIQSLSALHELLHENSISADVNIKEYLQKVVLFHEDMLHLLTGRVILETDISTHTVPARTAVSIGLIVNELITNAVKYAFPVERKGKINIHFSQEDKDTCVLTISDNGIGMADKPSDKGTNLGLNLVNILTEQLNGVMEMKSENGTSFQLRFNPALA